MQTNIWGMVFFVMGLCLVLTAGQGSTFDCGSDGSDGALNLTTSLESETITLDLPEDGIFNYTNVYVGPGVTLKFRRNSQNTPVYVLSQGDIVVEGQINVSGESGTSLPATAGKGGPGGFDGGQPGSIGTPAGAGLGPGGGQGGNRDDHRGAANAGCGSYSSAQLDENQTSEIGDQYDGKIYGTPLLVPLLGGSGGGGTNHQGSQPGRGGGGGGGALLLASNTQIRVSGALYAQGGYNNESDGQGISPGQGSGGALRLVGPVVSGTGTLGVAGGYTSWYYAVRGGRGRIRIDTLDRSNLSFNMTPNSFSVGTMMTIFPQNLPSLDIIEVAGQQISSGSGPVNVYLDTIDDPTQEVVVRASGFVGQLPLDVVVIPESGARRVYPVTADLDAADPATVSVEVVLEPNTMNHIFCWTANDN